MARGGDGEQAVSTAAASIVGQLGPIPADRAEALRAEGVPADAQVGISGLERRPRRRLRGAPGGVLLAGSRTLAGRAAAGPRPVRTTISPEVQQAARRPRWPGGSVASWRCDPRTGEVLAAGRHRAVRPAAARARRSRSSRSPPRSRRGVAKPDTPFPSRPRPRSRASSSRTPTASPAAARSCSRFAALLQLGLRAARRQARARSSSSTTASASASTRRPASPGAATPTIPPAGEIGDDLAVGSTAIGQGKVQATALADGRVAATIALDGRRAAADVRSYGQRRGTRARDHAARRARRCSA